MGVPTFLPGASVFMEVFPFLPGAVSAALGMSWFYSVALTSRGVPHTTFPEAVAAEEDVLGAESPQCLCSLYPRERKRGAGCGGSGPVTATCWVPGPASPPRSGEGGVSFLLLGTIWLPPSYLHSQDV